MPEVKAEWVQALRAIDDKAFLRWNDSVGRYEFGLSHADGIVRSQFWCDFSGPRNPVTGLQPFRDLNDDTMREALDNLQKTFVGNPYDGAGTVQKDVKRRYWENEDIKAKRWKDRGTEYAEFIWEHRRQIRDAGAGPVSGWTPQSEKVMSPIVVVSR